MEKTFDFRTKLMKVSLAVTLAFSVAASFVMLSYASSKTIIVDEEETEEINTQSVEEPVKRQWTIDVSSLQSFGDGKISVSLPDGKADDFLVALHYDTNSMEISIPGSYENYFLSKPCHGDFSHVCEMEGSYDKGTTVISLSFDTTVFCDVETNGKEAGLLLTYADDETRPIVFLDPGHGGSSYGTRVGEEAEKDIVLSIANQVAALCKDKPYRIALSRQADSTVNTEDRIRAVMNSNADYYIGIHLSSDVDDVKAFGLKATYNPTYFRNGLENVDFADAVLKNTATCTNNRAIGVEGASEEDVILKVLDIPATVLYAGYISNADEAELLSSEKYIKKIAEGIVTALDGVVE